ncbi:MAG: membrane assembly protein AsmA [Sphingobacteriaceae bacterium]|nr:membrane assembly protein AsmA [Sphingobacteriaceae bacterium]
MAESKPKKSLIGRIFKWTGITFLVLIILIIAAPFIFKDKIVSIVKEQANANLNAKVDFGEFDLTLISSFPDFRFKIQKVSVVGVDAFAGDTLASIGELITDINLKSVISGDQYKINSIIIDKARILGKILPDGKANWDIAKADSTAAAVPTATSEPSKFAMKLNEFKIKNAYIVYDDQQGKMYGKLDDFNYSLNGDFTQDNFVLSNLLEIAKTTFKMDGVPYLSEAKVKFKADLDMDMPKMKFTFKENELSLNDLGFGFDGYVSMPDTNIDMDLKFKVKQAEFKSLLSLIPVVYSKDFASVKTSGSLAMDGFAKGTYNASSMPAFAVNLAVKDAMFKYPSLPKSVNNINIDVHVNNPTGVLDATVIDVNKFHVELAGNPVDLSAHVTTPISDPNLKAGLKGVINLASVKEFVPLEKGDDLNGTIKSDISVAGRMSALEKKDFDNFKAEGSLEIEKMNYKTSTLTYEVLLNSMVLKFTNEYVDLPNFDAKLGKSDIQAKGRIDNFMHYLFKDEALKGGFALTSKMMDLNELMGPPSTETAAATPSAAPTSTDSGAAEVPGNIDFVLDSKIDKILFQNMVIDNLIGNIVVRNSKAEMTNLKMNTLDGTLIVNGFYETTNPKKPTTGLNLVIENFDIQKTFKTFNTVKKIAPAAEYSKGNFSATLQNFNVAMNDKMEPDLNTVKAFGTFKTKKVVVGGFPPFVKLGEALKMDKLKSTEVTDLNLKYRMENGRIILEPFDTKISGVNTNISGSTGIDQTIDYKWKMDMPKSMFGGAASGALDGLLKEANSKAGTNMAVGEKIKVNVLFGGTAMKPTVKTSLKEDTQSAVATVTTAVVNNAIDKAAEEAQKILDDAKAKCDQINAETAANVEKQKTDGYAEADKLVEAAGNPIAKIAAKKAAEAAKKKVDEKCEKLKADGEAKCAKNMEDAKARAAAKAAESKK